MPSYVTPKKNTEFVTYIGLPSVADANVFQSNPTIAAGDFQVSTDGGTLANLTTTPVVTPTGSKTVKVTVSAAEMNGDVITIEGSDVAGSQWKDVKIVISTTSRQIDDLAYPATTGRSMNVSATGEVDSDVVKVNTSSDAATKLGLVSAAIESGAAITGTLSTTQMSTDLTETTTNHYNGRIIIWTSGNLIRQSSTITAYDGTGKILTYNAVTEAPANTDTFIIV